MFIKFGEKIWHMGWATEEPLDFVGNTDRVTPGHGWCMDTPYSAYDVTRHLLNSNHFANQQP